MALSIRLNKTWAILVSSIKRESSFSGIFVLIVMDLSRACLFNLETTPLIMGAIAQSCKFILNLPDSILDKLSKSSINLARRSISV